jgi:hypothetical protein
MSIDSTNLLLQELKTLREPARKGHSAVRTGLLIFSTQDILARHASWSDILASFEWTWDKLVSALLTDLLDEVSRHGLAHLNDCDVTDLGYVGEVVYNVLHLLLTGEEEDANPNSEEEFPPDPYKEDYSLMYDELIAIAREFLSATAKHLLLFDQEEPLVGYYPYGICFSRLVGQDVSLSVHYSQLPTKDVHA